MIPIVYQADNGELRVIDIDGRHMPLIRFGVQSERALSGANADGDSRRLGAV